MTKLLTFKDFILYNNPCFSCNSKIDIKLIIHNEKTGICSYIAPNSLNGKMFFPLKVGYMSSLTLIFTPASNQFISNNLQEFISYKKDKQFIFLSTCRKCKTEIHSDKLKFDFNKNIITPLSIEQEFLVIKEKTRRFVILNNIVNGTKVTINIEDNKGNHIEQLQLEKFPLLSKFKTKEKCLAKLKTYILFS